MSNYRVVVAWAEHCHGPGWSNQIIWYLLQHPNGKLQIKALQPKEQTSSMKGVTFEVSHVVSKELTNEVVNQLNANSSDKVFDIFNS